jgi:hypothetical protein
VEHGSTILQRVIARDPIVLLYSDLATASSTQRKRLVDALVEEVERDRAGLTEAGFDDFAELSHPALAAQLREIVVDQSRHVEARRLALEIAFACAVEGLSEDLVSLATNRAENLGVRHHAALGARRLISPATRRGLLPLVLEDQPDDGLDQLREGLN